MEHVWPRVELFIDKLVSICCPVAIEKSLANWYLAHAARLKSKGHVIGVAIIKTKIADCLTQLLKHFDSSLQLKIYLVCAAIKAMFGLSQLRCLSESSGIDIFWSLSIINLLGWVRIFILVDIGEIVTTRIGLEQAQLKLLQAHHIACQLHSSAEISELNFVGEKVRAEEHFASVVHEPIARKRLNINTQAVLRPLWKTVVKKMAAYALHWSGLIVRQVHDLAQAEAGLVLK